MNHHRFLVAFFLVLPTVVCGQGRKVPHDMYNGIPCSTRYETATLPGGNLIYCHLAWDMPLMTVVKNGVSQQITCRANSYTHFDGKNRVEYCVTREGRTFGAIPQKPKPQPVQITNTNKPVQITTQPRVIKFK